jgi:NAD-dependent deacetylase
MIGLSAECQPSSVSAARRLLAEVSRVVVLTGAGVSEESGVPTFRGPGGLWRQFRPEDLATPEAFAHDPRLVWEWYNWRREKIAAVEPNPAHRALAELEARLPAGAATPGRSFTLVTQNVDDLHERAGSRAVLHLHGEIWRLRCTGCGREDYDRRVPLDPLPPVCACGGLLRPAVVWFGEALAPDTWDAAVGAAQACELVLVVGTSALVYPAASLPAIALQAGARLIEVNRDPTPLTPRADVSLQGKAGDLLPQLL